MYIELSKNESATASTKPTINPANPKDLLAYWLCNSLQEFKELELPNYKTYVEPSTLYFLETGNDVDSYSPCRKSGLEPISGADSATINSPAKVDHRIKCWLFARRAA